MKRFYTMILPLAFAATASEAELIPATFDDLKLAPESWWVGDTDNPDYESGTFRSGSFEFNNYYASDWGSWGFFGYANETGNVFPGGYAVKDQMLNCVGGGYRSENYGMGFIASYMGPTLITLPDFQETGVNVKGMWITNSAWVVNAILEGDGMSDAFGQGDYLTVTFKGYDATGDSRESTFFLADFRQENPEEHYYVDSWRYWDLSSLGDVVRIEADMFSTKSNAYGITTPCYFAFDDLGMANGDSGLCAPAVSGPEVRVVVADGVAAISASVADFTAEAVSISGERTVASAADGRLNLTLPAQGVNVLRIISADGVKTLKVINR